MRPCLDAAVAGPGQVWFVDAAHCVYGTYLCCLWSILRVFVRAASGRQRFNVLGAWNAVTRAFVSVTNTTVVNTDTMCALLRKIAALGLVGPATVVLDNARYQRNKVVQALAAELSIAPLYRPSYSPNLNRIERLWLVFSVIPYSFGMISLRYALRALRLLPEPDGDLVAAPAASPPNREAGGAP